MVIIFLTNIFTSNCTSVIMIAVCRPRVWIAYDGYFLTCYAIVVTETTIRSAIIEHVLASYIMPHITSLY